MNTQTISVVEAKDGKISTQTFDLEIQTPTEESKSKLEELSLYICKKLGLDPTIQEDKLRLNHILWRTDMESYRVTGKTITGAQYCIA